MAYYCLTNVKFDNSYKNGCYFSNYQVREDALLPENYNAIKQEINFNFGSLLNTTIIVNLYNNQNYCIIENNGNKYYYFITSSNYLSCNQWKLNLELDVITQYLTGCTTDNFNKSLIKRGHCNRWIKEGDNVKFDVSGNSQIIKHETKIDCTNTERKNIELKYSENDTVNNWINRNVVAWLYVFIDLKHTYKCLGYTGGTPLTPVLYDVQYNDFCFYVSMSDVKSDYAVMCVPIINKNVKMFVIDNVRNTKCNISTDGINDFYLFNNKTEFVYNIKLSKIPPCDFGAMGDIYSEDQSGNLLINMNVKYNNRVEGWRSGCIDVDCWGDLNEEIEQSSVYVVRNGAFVNVWQQYNDIECKPISVESRFTFPTAEIKGQRKMEFEPKILLECYRIVLRDSLNGEYFYNLLHLGTNELTALYSEPITITNNNYYYRLKSTGIVPSSYEKNWNGIVNTANYSQIVANDNIQNFLANNKNFLLTRTSSIAIPTLLSMITGNLGGVFEGVKGITKTIIDFDNLQNKANSLSNTNDTGNLSMIVNSGIKLYIDIQEAFEFDKKILYEYLYNYGYELNIIDNPFNYINTRKYFNYIQFECDFINVNAPFNAINKLKSIFSTGIKLWNDYSNIYNYTNENYEINI